MPAPQHKVPSIFGGVAAVLFATAYLVTVSGALKSRPVLWPLLLLGALGAAVVAFLWNWEALSGRRGLAFALGSILAVSPALGVLTAAAPEAISYRFFPQPQQGSNQTAPSDEQAVADLSDIVESLPGDVDPWPTWETDVRRAQARCDAVDASVPVKVETVTITEILGPVTLDYLRFENRELLEGRTLHLQSVGRTGLIAAMVRGERYFTEFFTFDLDDPKRLTKIGSLPEQAVLDLLIHPETGDLLFSYVSREDGCLAVGLSSMPQQLTRGVPLHESSQTRLFRTAPCLDPCPTWEGTWDVQNGGRIALLDRNHALLTVGDFALGPNSLGQQLQTLLRDELESEAGYGATHVVRLDTGESRRFTFGHRNPQGLVVDPQSGAIFLSEHGPNAGDEINVLAEGADYGWRSETYGKPYEGFGALQTEDFRRRYYEKVGSSGLNRWCAHSQATPPAVLLAPASGTAPSAMVLIAVPENNAERRLLLMATLANRALWSFDVAGNTLSSPRRAILNERLRDLHIVGDRELLLSFDGSGILLLRWQ